MAWIYLFVAGLFEIVWAVALKYSEGFTRLWPAVTVVVAMAASILLLSLALKVLPLGIAYPIWTGIGAAGAVIPGILLFHESRDVLKILFILMIVTGIIGLRLLKI